MGGTDPRPHELAGHDGEGTADDVLADPCEDVGLTAAVDEGAAVVADLRELREEVLDPMRRGGGPGREIDGFEEAADLRAFVRYSSENFTPERMSRRSRTVAPAYPLSESAGMWVVTRSSTLSIPASARAPTTIETIDLLTEKSMCRRAGFIGHAYSSAMATPPRVTSQASV